jgi:hypothetical protein
LRISDDERTDEMMTKEIGRLNRLREVADRQGFRLTFDRDGKYRLTDLRGEGGGPTLHGGFAAIEGFLAQREAKTVSKP